MGDQQRHDRDARQQHADPYRRAGVARSTASPRCAPAILNTSPSDRQYRGTAIWFATRPRSNVPAMPTPNGTDTHSPINPASPEVSADSRSGASYEPTPGPAAANDTVMIDVITVASSSWPNESSLTTENAMERPGP